MDRKYDVITLGEILLRLSTPINGRLAQGDTFMKHLGGAELNIASEIGQLGLNTAIISKIPTNLLAAFIKNQLNASRVSENYLIEDHSDDSRVGIYYYEYGSYPRKPRVVYDRKHSSINNIEISDVPQTLFYNTRLFHTSGITLGLGGKAQDFAIHCIKEFKKQGTLISFDVNYRANLWTGEEARNLADKEATNMAVCNSGGLRVREEGSLDAPVITLVAEGEELEVVDIQDDWVKIMLDDEAAYVSADYVDIAKKLEKAVSLTELKYGQGVSDIRVDLVNYAKQFLGNPYVWGGTSLTKGADCSGFVLSIMKKYGVSLPHHSGSQAQCGKKVSLSEAQPGDLVFYAKNGKINHVAIYIGGGQVIHASNPRTGIKISNVSYRTPYSVRRVLS